MVLFLLCKNFDQKDIFGLAVFILDMKTGGHELLLSVVSIVDSQQYSVIYVLLSCLPVFWGY